MKEQKIDKKLKVCDDEEDLWRDFENSQMMGNNSRFDLINAELRRYLLEKRASKDMLPNNYWCQNKKEYQKLSV